MAAKLPAMTGGESGTTNGFGGKVGFTLNLKMCFTLLPAKLPAKLAVLAGSLAGRSSQPCHELEAGLFTVQPRDAGGLLTLLEPAGDLANLVEEVFHLAAFRKQGLGDFGRRREIASFELRT